MDDEVFARRDLIRPDRLKALSLKSNAHGFLQLGGHVGAILVTGVLLHLTWGTWVAVPVFLLHGTLINFLYAGQHEMSHWTVFQTRRLNEIFGRILGFVLIYPRDFDQIQHFAHHRWTQDLDRDGELAGRPPYTFGSYVLWLTGITYWQTRAARIWRFTRGIVREPYIPEGRKPDVIREGRLHFAGYVLIALLSVAFHSWFAVIYWLAPMLLTKVTQQLQNTIEHLGLSHSANIFENTRSTRTNLLVRRMAWNMPYHTAHHAFPGVPFWQLPGLDAEITASRGKAPPSMTYLGFQKKVLAALWRVKTERDYPTNGIWITDDGIAAPVATEASRA
ncbi:MAG: rhizopine catabolism protein [Phyllobacteriaceae bacterium]|nr:rhizopine catabolism protein [Phyllobacteriaceae bacterium]